MPRQSSRYPSSLRPWAATAAFIGGVLWTAKSLSILAADEQPDYAFEVAPFFFGVAAVGLVSVWQETQPKPGLRPYLAALVGAGSGAVAGVAYVAGATEEVFGPALMASSIVVVGVLLYTGRSILRERALGDLSSIPWALGWLYLAAIPVGGVLEAMNERLLEVPLLAIALGWLALSFSALGFGVRSFNARSGAQ